MTTRDYFTLLKKAEKGDHEAQFHVGHHYYRLREFTKAHNWWLKTAKQNSWKQLQVLKRYTHIKAEYLAKKMN
jgi:hypothetical protein